MQIPSAWFGQLRIDQIALVARLMAHGFDDVPGKLVVPRDARRRAEAAGLSVDHCTRLLGELADAGIVRVSRWRLTFNRPTVGDRVVTSIVPRHIARSLDLSLAELGVVSAVLYVASDQRDSSSAWAWPTMKRLGEITGRDPGHVRRVLRSIADRTDFVLLEARHRRPAAIVVQLDPLVDLAGIPEGASSTAGRTVRCRQEEGVDKPPERARLTRIGVAEPVGLTRIGVAVDAHPRRPIENSLQGEVTSAISSDQRPKSVEMTRESSERATQERSDPANESTLVDALASVTNISDWSLSPPDVFGIDPNCPDCAGVGEIPDDPGVTCPCGHVPLNDQRTA